MEEQLSMQALVVVGGVMGGAFATANAVLRFAQSALERRRGVRNGNDRGAVQHAELVHAIDGFKSSHSVLKEQLSRLTEAQIAATTQWELFIAAFTRHMEDFKCLRVTKE